METPSQTILKILPQHIYDKYRDIIVGVNILEGVLEIGTQLALDTGLYLGTIIAMENNRETIISANKGENIVIRIKTDLRYGRHFDYNNILKSI